MQKREKMRSEVRPRWWWLRSVWVQAAQRTRRGRAAAFHGESPRPRRGAPRPTRQAPVRPPDAAAGWSRRLPPRAPLPRRPQPPRRSLPANPQSPRPSPPTSETQFTSLEFHRNPEPSNLANQIATCSTQPATLLPPGAPCSIDRAGPHREMPTVGIARTSSTTSASAIASRDRAIPIRSASSALLAQPGGVDQLHRNPLHRRRARSPCRASSPAPQSQSPARAPPAG